MRAGVIARRGRPTAPTVRAVSNGSVGSGPRTSFQFPTPSGEIDDLLVLIVSRRGAASLNTPTGFTLLFTQARNTAGMVFVFTRIADTQESPNTQIIFNTTGASTHTASILRIKGASKTRPIDYASNLSTSTTEIITPEITPTYDGSLIVRAAASAIIDITAQTFAWDAPAIEVAYAATTIETAGTGNAAQTVATDPSPTEKRRVSMSASGTTAQFTLAIPPA